MLRGCSWDSSSCVLGGRALAYAATPTPLTGELGGPRLPVIAVVALALGRAALVRRALARRAGRARAARARARARPGAAALARPLRPGQPALLGGGSLAAFAALETWIHVARRHAHALVAVPRRARAPQRRARSCSRSRSPPRRCSPRSATPSPGRGASCTSCGACCCRARRPAAAARRSVASRPPWRGCSHARCARAGRPRSPSRSHANERRATMKRTQACRASRALASSSQPSRSRRARSHTPICFRTRSRPVTTQLFSSPCRTRRRTPPRPRSDHGPERLRGGERRDRPRLDRTA